MQNQSCICKWTICVHIVFKVAPYCTSWMTWHLLKWNFILWTSKMSYTGNSHMRLHKTWNTLFSIKYMEIRCGQMLNIAKASSCFIVTWVKKHQILENGTTQESNLCLQRVTHHGSSAPGFILTGIPVLAHRRYSPVWQDRPLRFGSDLRGHRCKDQRALNYEWPNCRNCYLGYT